MRFYGLILILALGLRVWGLGLNPVGLVHDEIHDIINAKSIALTGQGAPGTIAGILPSSGYCDGNCIFGELATIILSVWTKVTPFNIFWIKIPFLVASALIVYFGGKLLENITKNKKIGELTSLLIAISPWAIHFGRTTYENLFAYALFFASLYLWTKNKAGNKEAFWATILGLLASLSYFGAKVIWLPLMLIGLVYWKVNNKKKLWPMLIWSLVSIGLFIGYWLCLKSSSAGIRTKELNWQNSKISQIVDDERRMSLTMPLGLERVVSNKVVVMIREVGQKYLNVFSFRYFLSDSEGSFDNFSVPGHGYVYLLEIVLAVFGLVIMYKISPKAWIFIIALFLVLPIPGAINNTGVTYALRAGMIFPLISGLGAIGIYELNKIIKRKNIVYWGLLVGFIFSLIYFEILYWYRLPFEKSAGYVFYERAIVNYISLLKKESNKLISVTTNDPIDLMYNYAFYTGKYSDKNWATAMNKSILSGNYEIDGVKILRSCPTKMNVETIYIFERQMGCVQEPNMLPRISEPRDGGAKFFIPEEKLCQGIELGSFPYPRKIEDFSVEKMDKDTFCKMWVSQPKI